MATTPDLREIMKERRQKYVDLMNAGDSKGLAQMYTLDAKMLNQGQKMLSGREEISRAFDGLLSDDNTEESTLEDVFGKYGDEFVTTRSANKSMSKDGEKTVTGKDVVVWKNVDGEYLIHVDIWNMDE